MALKSDLQEILSLDFWEGYEGDSNNGIKLISEEIVKVYIDSIKNGQDSLGNKALTSVVKSNLIEQAIQADFNLALSTGQFMKSVSLSSSLVAAWAGTPLKAKSPSPILKTPPGFSIVATAITSSSTPPPIFSLSSSEAKDNTEIVNLFYNSFDIHTKSIIFTYTGTSTTVPPAPITLPVTSYTLR